MIVTALGALAVLTASVVVALWALDDLLREFDDRQEKAWEESPEEGKPRSGRLPSKTSN